MSASERTEAKFQNSAIMLGDGRRGGRRGREGGMVGKGVSKMAAERMEANLPITAWGRGGGGGRSPGRLEWQPVPLIDEPQVS